MHIKHLLILAGTVALAGCAGDDADLASTGSAFGESVRQTFAAQIIDPAPSYAEAVPPTSGNHAAAAIDRYETDKVKKPDRTATSSLASGGSGGR